MRTTKPLGESAYIYRLRFSCGHSKSYAQHYSRWEPRTNSSLSAKAIARNPDLEPGFPLLQADQPFRLLNRISAASRFTEATLSYFTWLARPWFSTLLGSARRACRRSSQADACQPPPIRLPGPPPGRFECFLPASCTPQASPCADAQDTARSS